MLKLHNLEIVSQNQFKTDIGNFRTVHVVFRDTTTGVLYHGISGQNGASLTPILDPDGKPVVDKTK